MGINLSIENLIQIKIKYLKKFQNKRRCLRRKEPGNRILKIMLECSSLLLISGYWSDSPQNRLNGFHSFYI